ncbi:MAG: glycosyltransferase [candidate division Zixibacteria bacterium]|nr:glycosyltransferase [candidate division Zixibacteria bacterium]
MYGPSDISVVVPVGNGSPRAAGVVGRVLSASPPPGEVVVVDDAVSDGSLDGLPADERVRVVANGRGRGPAGARNAGAEAAAKDIILFIDADVFVPRDIFARLTEAYGDAVDAVLGVEAESADLPNFASRYKNLWMRFTYLILPRQVGLFYTSCASIKKDVFWAAGGFDESYKVPSVEDTAFGRALGARGARVVLEKDIEVEHRKTYGTKEALVTAFRRGAALARCVLRAGRRPGGNRTSVPTSFIASLPLAALFVLWAALAPFFWKLAVVGAAATLAAIYIFNVKWLAFLGRRGPAMTLGALFFLPLELAFGLGGGAWGTASYYLLKRRY